MTLRKETAQDQGEDQQSIVPERADVIFAAGWRRGGKFGDPRAIVDFITQCTSPELQQTKSKRDQPSREPAFDLQLFFREVFAGARSSPQRYVAGLGSPIWSRMRHTTVSTTAVMELGRL